MALPSFGAADGEAEVSAEVFEPLSPLALQAVEDDDELLPGPEDDVEGQVECFLETLPTSDAHEVVHSLLESDTPESKGIVELQVDDRSERIEESCEFLLRLLEFCPSVEKRQHVLETWLRRNPRENHPRKGKKSLSPATSSDFLELRRVQRLNSNVMTPAVSMRAESPGRRCFGREPGEQLFTLHEFAPVQEAFRSYDKQCPGSIDTKCLAKVLRVGGLTDDEISKLLQGAGLGVSSEPVDYEAFLEWMFRR
ncbi:unnamed protein product [Cladocopium goreaui]|uniref:EF-hand domain-containing protein n=1 Tax=Cladocopium goreaui TaxID=2562237 RepID=A0A9P1FRZ9_9DINO|nr:unnamed protein product [Cladocopium goreaui]